MQTCFGVDGVGVARQDSDVGRQRAKVGDRAVDLVASDTVDEEVVVIAVLLRRPRLDVRQSDLLFLFNTYTTDQAVAATKKTIQTRIFCRFNVTVNAAADCSRCFVFS